MKKIIFKQNSLNEDNEKFVFSYIICEKKTLIIDNQVFLLQKYSILKPN